MTETNELQTAFNYDVFDRQLETYYMMCQVLIREWEDCGTQEMSFDIRSLCTKASRLCCLADQDLALQHADPTHRRKLANEHHLKNMEKVIVELSPFFRGVANHYRDTKELQGHKSPLFAAQASILLPKLRDVLMDDGMGEQELENMLSDIQTVEQTFLKRVKFAKYPGVRPEERFWNLVQFVALSCYLVQHFRRAAHCSGRVMEDEDWGRYTVAGVQGCLQDEKMREKLDLYFSTLEYNHGKGNLGEEEMRQAQRELQKEVPQSVLLPYLHHADDAYQMGVELSKCRFTADECSQLFLTTAKWQILETNIYMLRHPEEIEESLGNEVFYKVVNGRLVDMNELKNTISKLIPLVNRKNQWFCVWCVLKHHSLLQNLSHEAFARQMMSKDWFGNVVTAQQRFSGDTLREYKRYFSEYDYTQWDNEVFLEQKQLFGMTKWSDSLCGKFKQKCQEMEQAMMGWNFLGANA